MNLIREAPAWLLAFLAALLLVAAMEDAIRRRISNLTCAAVLIAALMAMTLVGFSIDAWQNGVTLLIVLTLGTVAFGQGWLGGGDVKLLAALGLWVNFSTAILLFSLIFVAGGVLAVVYPLSRIMVGQRMAARGQCVPYGVAVAMGALTFIAVQAAPSSLGSRATAELTRPSIDQQ